MTLFTSFSRLFRVLGCVVLLFSTLSLSAAPPRWLRSLPKASNSNYRYVKEDATAATEEEAFNKALAHVLQDAILSLGLGYNSTQIEAAIRTGNLESKITEWRIPVNPVCHYRQGLENGAVRVYVLCQVANAGNVDPHFDEFRNCGNDGDDYAGQMNLRPSHWSMYEMDTYFSEFEDVERPSDVDEMTFKSQIQAYAKQSLVDNLVLKDSTLIQMIQTDAHYFKNMGYAVAYIKRDVIIDKYTDEVQEGLDTYFALVENAETYVADGNMGEAKAILTRVKMQMEDLDLIIRFMSSYASTRAVERFKEDSKELTKRINIQLFTSEGNSGRAKEGKIHEYIQTGNTLLDKQMVGDALRYFYAAQLLLRDIENNGHITVEDEVSKREISANTYLNTKITEVLKNIQVICDGFLPGSNSEMQLSFRYKNEPISNLNFSYNDNMGWSDLFPVANGWSSVVLQESNRPNMIRVRTEYRYADEANFDPELPALVEKYAKDLNYDSSAETLVSVVSKTVRIGQSSSVASMKHSTNIAQNYVAANVEDDAHRVADSVTYHNRILQVCEAIKSKNYQSVYPLFTQNGYSQFERLMSYGNARIITTEACRYVRIGTDVQCRSIPMNFSFPKSKQQLENVVFTFNNYGLIDGVQFALEEVAARNVMCDNGIDELSRLTLINFLENYKTAFALKRLEYIESIFSDDAVIITGRVLRTTEQSPEFKNIQNTMDNQVIRGNVLYTRMSKEHYIKRLKNSFSSKEWINIKFGGTTIDSSKQSNTFGVRLVQDYFSNNYGDHGYLFLLIDTSDRENPLIRVRMWQPEIDENVQPFSMEEYDLLTRGMEKFQ